MKRNIYEIVGSWYEIEPLSEEELQFLKDNPDVTKWYYMHKAIMWGCFWIGVGLAIGG